MLVGLMGSDFDVQEGWLLFYLLSTILQFVWNVWFDYDLNSLVIFDYDLNSLVTPMDKIKHSSLLWILKCLHLYAREHRLSYLWKLLVSNHWMRILINWEKNWISGFWARSVLHFFMRAWIWSFMQWSVIITRSSSMFTWTLNTHSQ